MRGSRKVSDGSEKTLKRISDPDVLLSDELRVVAPLFEEFSRHLRDDMLLSYAQAVLTTLLRAVEARRTIWLCGDGVGHCLAMQVDYLFNVEISKYENVVQSFVLGTNAAYSTFLNGRGEGSRVYAEELHAKAKSGDVLWCFAQDAGAVTVVNAANKARELHMPVAAFTTYPGTPLVNLSDSAVRIQLSDDLAGGAISLQGIYSVVATVVCGQLKRAMRRRISRAQ